MILKFFASYNGTVESSSTIPVALRKYALKHARVWHFTFDEGSYLVQQIRGRNFSIWTHHLSLRQDIRLAAFFDDLCHTINYTQMGNLSCELKGYGPVALQESTYHFFCVPPKVMHPCYFKPGVYCFMHLDMDKELLSHIDFNPICREALQKYFQDPVNNGTKLPACSIQPIVKDCMQRIAHCSLEDRAAYDAYIAHQVSRLLFEFNRQIPKIKAQHKNDFMNRRMDELKVHIASNLGKKLNVADLAALFPVSPVTLRSFFKKREGQSLYAYILSRRMQIGRQLLLESDKSISTIAAELSYELLSSFSRAYKKYFGLSPEETRENP